MKDASISEINETVKSKLDSLKDILRRTEGCAIAYSGGVDSTLLVAVAYEVLGDKCLAVTATSSTYPEREFARALEWIKKTGIKHVVIESEELDIEGFSENPVNRCYYCKHELFTKVKIQADKYGIKYIADGANADDAGDYRPGMKAGAELGVISPLLEAGLNKNDIRTISKYIYNLPTAEKQAMACLASRFPYGSTITREKLSQVEAVETLLEQEGFKVFRARHHGDIVRLELGKEELVKILNDNIRQRITKHSHSQGFKFVTVDLEGYRTGSFNDFS